MKDRFGCFCRTEASRVEKHAEKQEISDGDVVVEVIESDMARSLVVVREAVDCLDYISQIS